MQTKLIIFVIGLLGATAAIISRKNPLKFLFWLGIFFLWIRQLSFPIIETLNLSFLIFTFIVFIKPSILFNRINFKEWRFWYIVLLIGFFNALFFGFQKEFFVDTSIFTRSLDWSLSFFVVIFISSAVNYFIYTREDMNKLLNLFLLSCLIFSLSAVLAYFGYYDGIFNQSGGQNLFRDYSSDIIYSEVYGISSSNLIFGVSCLGIVFLPYLNWKVWKKFLFLTVLAFAVIISLKRIAILSLVLALLYYLIIEKIKNNNIWLLFIPIILLTIGTTYFDIIFSRFNSTFSTLSQTGQADISSQIRINRFKLAWETFLKNPFFGQGSGYLTFVHNGFLEILGNLGFLGLILFKPLIKPLQNIKRNFYNPWAISLIIFMVTLVAFEAAINRIEIMYFLGLLYGGYLVSLKIK